MLAWEGKAAPASAKERAKEAATRLLFNDMLGSTLAVLDDDKAQDTGMTLFGETPDGQGAGFFTGKPHIDELGYAFLFRNYRPEKAKWQTADPLGYPDGWNALAYCGNNCLVNVDCLGLKCNYCATQYIAEGRTWWEVNREKCQHFLESVQVKSPDPVQTIQISCLPNGHESQSFQITSHKLDILLTIPIPKIPGVNLSLQWRGDEITKDVQLEYVCNIGGASEPHATRGYTVVEYYMAYYVKVEFWYCPHCKGIYGLAKEKEPNSDHFIPQLKRSVPCAKPE